MIKLRKATSNEFKFYYELKCEQSSVYWGGFLEAPNIADLKSFWYKYVNQNDSERELLILENGGVLLGYVQAVFEGDSIGLSMGILESARGKGFGKTIIRLAVDHYPTCQKFFCYIR